jgi:hypothetical protein
VWDKVRGRAPPCGAWAHTWGSIHKKGAPAITLRNPFFASPPSTTASSIGLIRHAYQHACEDKTAWNDDRAKSVRDATSESDAWRDSKSSHTHTTSSSASNRATSYGRTNRAFREPRVSSWKRCVREPWKSHVQRMSGPP